MAATTATLMRGRRLDSRPFYTVILLLSVLTAYSFVSHTLHHGRDTPDETRALLKRNENPECGAVHEADDKCAFVRKYCTDDDAGLIPYLELYYCTFGSVQPVAFVGLTAWLGLLFTTIGIAASDFFSVNLSTISTILGLSESLAGVTFLAFGNGSPDVFSTFAAMGSNSASMAVGELIGAASFITGVVAGSMALVREFRVDRKTYARDICFFIIAVCFTTVFLADGHLHFWECWLMIGYYILYVTTVVCWHWVSTRRKQRRRREGEARSHVYGPSGHSGDELAGEPYRDDPDESDHGTFAASSRSPDINALEAGPRIEVDGHRPFVNEDLDEDEASSEDHDRMVAAEVASSMRVLRTRGRRRHTLTPIRPSLVGALEFRSALAQLQREGNLQLSAIPERSYSENHVSKRGRRGTASVVLDSSTSDGRPATSQPAPAIKRERALSHGDAPVGMDHQDLLIPGRDRADTNLSIPQSSGARTPSPSPSYTIGGNLAPPPVGQPGAAPEDESDHNPHVRLLSPSLQLQIPSRRSSYSDRSSPASQFPLYTDSPALLSPNPHSEPSEFVAPGLVSRDSPFADLHLAAREPTPVKWWPYAILPPPHVLLATLFPTLQGWEDKAIWDKFVSAISVPSIFLLVTTLPVVESETTNDDESLLATILEPSSGIGHVAPPISIEPQAMESESEWQRYRRHTLSRGNSYVASPLVSPFMAGLQREETLVAPDSEFSLGPPAVVMKPASEIPSAATSRNEPTGWNRWLVGFQLFTGPLFAVFILWANMMEDFEKPGRVLVMMVLYTLLGSLLLLGLMLMFTTEEKRPKRHYMLCFMGFIIAIAWISTIAGEVVGVLKTFGVVLGISEALLGLTIFAAGNSVGDLVADITVARLGYPVMALSACFGGPMLNILLGIGIGGVAMMMKKANHKHRLNPDLPIQYKPYKVQVGGTLMVSAITLLVMLVGLLIIVPMNKWVLSRKIGYGLIALWAVSTVVNVIVEVTGAWGDM
ncbi:Sodium/calcium exchanger protein-domain-containing protein [Dactylonectria estremocensis]|uniref:Sodium/calcium exchanger protein-domain-containing protein n=1 Tax=Dactylonectria estremocensis TaxID=1079267 RepID=A0A9P9FKU7_9HYPO|nr:Sodium/calcium exchanger protein-domain-containing protein [Dactylonectria estremocensis]